MNLFHSARLKLTGFYFASLVVFCLLLTLGVRAFTNYELNRGDDARRGAVQKLFQRWSDDYPGAPQSGDRMFAHTQEQQTDVILRNLNRDFLYLNILLLGSGAILSYWYAGRTLRPLERVHEQQKRFTSDASHELRTPLATMKVENEVFLRQKQFSESDARDLISSNLEEVDRLERLASNLLALNQYEQHAITKRPVEVDQVVLAALERVKRQTSVKRHPRFTVRIAPATIQADQESLTELITILLDNAVKYGPEDGEIVVAGERRTNSYVIAVRDHGPGIPDTDMPHIFERMYRGDKARSSRVSGHGIGLSLAKRIADVHGATIEAANHPQGGAMFILTLPQ